MRVLRPASLLLASVLLPTLAPADMFRPSTKDQIRMGKDFAKQIAKEEKILPASDPRVAELRRLGQELVKRIPAEEQKKRPFEYTFDVIENPEINAFAVPGGPIYFYTGLLEKMTSEDEVAGVLAHEITHIRNMHWASAYADNMKRRMGLTILLGVLKAGDSIYTVADLLDTFAVGLPYSRKHETEADRIGFQLMTSAGHNPQGMVDFMKILATESKSKPQEWMSTHPDSVKRVKTLEEMILKSGKTYRPQVARADETLIKAIPKPTKKKEPQKP